MKPKLTNNVIIRIDENLKEELAKLQIESGCPISEFLRQCLSSLVDYYKKNKSITLPVVIIPQKELAHLLSDEKKTSRNR